MPRLRRHIELIEEWLDAVNCEQPPWIRDMVGKAARLFGLPEDEVLDVWNSSTAGERFDDPFSLVPINRFLHDLRVRYGKLSPVEDSNEADCDSADEGE